MLDNYKRKLASLASRLTTRKPESREEAQGLLSSQSLDSLEIFADGDNDRFNIVYWVFFLYGIAMLLPWNVFITASEYFAKRFKGTPYAESFQNYFSTYFTIVNLLVFAALLWKQNKSAATFRIDNLWPVIFNTVIFAVMAATVESDMQGSGYFWFTMLLLVITGATTSLFQMAVFAEASRFPSPYVQAVMSGQGIAGVAVAVSSILSAFAGSATRTPDEADTSRAAFLYFMSALVITVAALVGRFIVARQPFYIRQISMNASVLVADPEEDEDLEDAERFLAEQEDVTLYGVIRKSAGLIFAVSYVFVITLVLFPSVTALIKSVARHDPKIPNAPTQLSDNNRFLDDDVFVAFHFVLFNVGDWVGRTLPIFDILRTFNAKWLVCFSLARTVFVPLFLFCNVVTSDRTLPVWIDSDIAYFILVWLFAVSNGWLGSLTMMAAPQQSTVTCSAEKSLVGSVMSFSLVVGLAIGGSMSFWIRSFV